MVVTNPITTTHVNRIANQPLMNSMAFEGYRSADVVHPRGGYQKLITITTPIFYHRDGHYVRPNRVAFKYFDFKKDVVLDVHVKVFNSIIKENAETFEKYIINAFSYMLKDIASN